MDSEARLFVLNFVEPNQTEVGVKPNPSTGFAAYFFLSLIIIVIYNLIKVL